MSSSAVSASPTPGNVHETVETRPLGVLVLSKTRNYLSPFPYSPDASEEPGIPLPPPRHTEYSPTGDHLVTVEDDDEAAAVIRFATTGAVLASCGGASDPDTPLKNNFATFSPLGSYLLTWARPVAGVSVPNLVIYDVSSGKRLAAFHQKTFHIDYWPSIQWSDDESLASRAVTNTIHFFPGGDLASPPVAKLGVPGVAKFALSRGAAPYTIATFTPGVKGGPGRIASYSHPDAGGAELTTRSTFRADSVVFKWNSRGTAALAILSTVVDSTGKSYYGESEVYFIDARAHTERRVDLPHEGPTYDAAWSPTGNELIIIYGYMPARATMFNDKCEPVFDFGTGSRNTISFSPHGRYVALAGFGNLAGEAEFWDKNKTTLVGRADLSCTTQFSWSPCSRYFLAATTFPRLRVDNGYQVVRFDGKVIHKHDFKDTALFQAKFRPAARGTYDDPKATAEDMIGGPVQSVDAASVNGGTEKKKGGVYRPPGSRGAASTIVLHQHVQAGKVDKASFMASAATASLSARREDELGGGKKVGPKFVPGMDPDMLGGAGGPSKASIARRRKKERVAAEAAAAANGGAATAADDIITSVEAGEKKAKKLRKKLRAIEKMKASKDEGMELQSDQLEKVAMAASVAEELSKLEKRIAELQA